MGIIKKLDNSLIDKIAAGEVVERPASVVKELIENSIDANATNIKIEIEESGIKLIKIKDNGIGMTKEDALLSFQRHATSKINNEDDLFSISTLGFRGEALASIAAVSKLSIKTSKHNLGTEIIVHGGNLISDNVIGLDKGTTIIVEDLFYNTPARKKYLKSRSTELSHIIDIVTRYALNYTTISFVLTHNKKTILNSPSTEDSLNNIVSVYGKDIAKGLIKVDSDINNISVDGFISKPNLTKLSKDYQSIFINGRYVKNKLINDAVYEAYGNLLFLNRNPIFILNVIIDFKDVDVNVHPSKIHIKLSHEDSIKYAIKNAVKKALDENDLVPEIKYKEKSEQQILDNDEQKFDEKEFTLKEKPTKNYLLEKSNQKELINLEEKSLTKQDEIDFKILGQYDKTYIVIEDNEGLKIIDQHAAEERINFEKFLKEIENNDVNKQNLLDPIVIEVSPKESNIIIEGKNKLKELGFDIEEFGTNEFIIRTSPSIFNKQQTKDFLFDLINEAEVSKQRIDELNYNKIASKSCRSSIKAGDELTYLSMKKLILNLKKCENPYTCPHGRPTMLKFTTDDIEKMFKRK
ncbi:MAG: DNA mismatch repair endonuclease MutL [Candidatus Woesearchaeota archaeon]